MLEQTARAGAARDRSARGCAVAAVPGRGFDRVFTGHFYGHLARTTSGALPRGGARVAGELVVVDSARAAVDVDEAVQERVLERRLDLGGLQAVVHRRRSRRRARRGRRAARRPLVRRRALAGVTRVPVARLAAARPGRGAGRASKPAIPSRRCRCSRRSTISARTCSARRPASSRARSGGRGAAARAGRFAAGSSSTRTSSTRPSTARRSRAAIRVAQPRAVATAPRRREEQELCEGWRDHELRLLRPRLIVTVGGLAAARLLGVAERHGVRRRPLPARRRRRDPVAASVRGEQLAERPAESPTRRRRGPTRARRACPALTPVPLTK